MKQILIILDPIFTLTYFIIIDQVVIRKINVEESLITNIIFTFILWLPLTFIFLKYVHPLWQIIHQDVILNNLKFIEEFKYRFLDKTIKKDEGNLSIKNIFYWTMFSNLLITFASITIEIIKNNI